MFHFQATTINHLFVHALDCVQRHGAAVAPRGNETLEVFPAVFELSNPRARVLTVEGRYINPAFAVAEALWILSGSDAPWIFEYNSKLERYSNDGKLRGAYGPRLRSWAGRIDQLNKVRELLTEDPSSRRAVIQIYDPSSVSSQDLDIPCTIGYRFMIRNKRLQLFVTMRSQDLWLGFPYDIFSNTVIQELMASWLNVSLGHYYHCVDSLHLYKHNLASASQVRLPPQSNGPTMGPIDFEWKTLPEVVQSVLLGTIAETHPLAPWAHTLQSYRSWKNGDRTAALAHAANVNGPLRIVVNRWYQSLMNGD